MCKTHPDSGAAQVAFALPDHPEHGRDNLDGLGWWEACAGRAN